MLVFASCFSDLGVIFKGRGVCVCVGGVLFVCYLVPHPPLVPFSISLIMCYYGVLSFHLT